MRSSAFFVLFLVVALCGATGGCRERRHGAARRTEAVAPQVNAPHESLLSPAGIAQFRQAVGAKWNAQIATLRVELSPERAAIQLRAPDDPSSLVEFVYTGTEFAGPFALTQRGSGQLEQNLFQFSAVDWDALPALLEAAKGRVDSQYGEPNRVLVRRNLPQDESVGFRVYVASPYRDSQVDADAHGKLIEPGRYP